VSVSVKVEGGLEQVLSVGKQIEFAAARALTEAAKQGQAASIRAVEGTFTTRSKWYQPGNRFGVRVTAARKGSLEASVHTAADWLALHETGGVKTPRGRNIAVPTGNVRRTKRQLISKSQRPRNLRRAFILPTAAGPVLFQRKNKRTIVALYQLEPRARIRRESTVVGPVTKVVERRFGSIFEKALRHALETAK
jgi:hypothetical protein